MKVFSENFVWIKENVNPGEGVGRDEIVTLVEVAFGRTPRDERLHGRGKVRWIGRESCRCSGYLNDR